MELELKRLRMEINVLKETMGLSEKDPSVDLKELSNRERFLVVDALRGRWPAGDPVHADALGAQLPLPSSLAPAGTGAEARRAKDEMRTAFERNQRAYDYRRLYDAMNASGCGVCEGLVRSLTDEPGIQHPRLRRRRKYSPYMGETPARPSRTAGARLSLDGAGREAANRHHRVRPGGRQAPPESGHRLLQRQDAGPYDGKAPRRAVGRHHARTARDGAPRAPGRPSIPTRSATTGGRDGYGA